MHVNITDQESGAHGILCVDRDSTNCEILHCTDPILLPKLIDIAKTLKVDRLTIVAAPEGVEELINEGFVVTDRRVMEMRVSVPRKVSDHDAENLRSLMR